MHDFLQFVINLLHRGMALATFAVALCCVGVAVAYVVFRLVTKGKKRFPWGKVILSLMLVGYLAVLVYVTLLRYGGGGYSDMNLHLFRAWREAWNSFSEQNWLNVLLNVAMFVPLGVILPLLAKWFRKWYCMLAVGFGLSLAIEAVQYATARGVLDVDDLFANTLGAMLGFGITMVCITARRKREKRAARCLAYAAVPLAFAVAMAWIFVGYRVQEYGNLPEVPTFTVDTRGVEWKLECELSPTAQPVPTYRTEPFTKASCDAFGAAFAEKMGITFKDVYYYDNCTIFANHFTGDFLNVSYFDRSYSYSVGGVSSGARTQVDEATLREQLAPYDIVIPDTAEFAYEGDGWHTFTADMQFVEDAVIVGTLRCRCVGGKLEWIENQLVSCTFYEQVEILSPTAACARLCAGKFDRGDAFEYYAPTSVTVKSCTLEYRIDTKGFYQPVYVFAVETNGFDIGELVVSAMQ